MVEASERVHVFSLPRCLSVACLFGLLVRPVFYQGWLLSLFDAYSAFFVMGGTAAHVHPSASNPSMLRQWWASAVDDPIHGAALRVV